MDYSLEIGDDAIVELNNVPARYYRRVVELIDALAFDPYPSRSKQMNDPMSHFRRVRLDKWRIVYKVDETEKVVTIVKVGEKTGTGTDFYDDLG